MLKIIGKLKYLNVGCGNKFHKDWVNVDMNPSHPEVLDCNLIKGIPFPDNSFQVVYHSQVLEHFPKEAAPEFLRECHRILEVGGTMRVVVPDLENIVNEYKKHLLKLSKFWDQKIAANYDWIMLELLDQSVRHFSGGYMAEYLQQKNLINQQYIMERIGYHSSTNIKNYYSEAKLSIGSLIKKHGLLGFGIKVIQRLIKRLLELLFGKKYKLGDYRMGGEIHLWMYDRYSLQRLLKSVGFREIRIVSAKKSSISNWENFELDIKDGHVFDPTSIFVEAKK